MAIYNNADGDFIISEMVRAKVYYNGTVLWRPPIISKTFCEIRVADFPFGMFLIKLSSIDLDFDIN